MDTYNLSLETKRAVMYEAEALTRDLMLCFACLAIECKNETEYLEQSKELVLEIIEIDPDSEDLFDEMSWLFFGNIPDMNQLHKTLNKILQNIEEVSKIPLDKREYEEW